MSNEPWASLRRTVALPATRVSDSDRRSDRHELKSLIRSDLHRYFGRVDPWTVLYAFLRVPGFRYTFFLRRTNYHYQKPGFFHWLAFHINNALLNHYGMKYGFQLPFMTRIGRGLAIFHHGAVLVSSRAVIGDNVNLCPGVAIGENIRGKRAGAPVIGNRVWIGVNAVIVGGISVGDDAMIAPGAYVSSDVPSRAVVAGNPGQIMSYAGSQHYILNIAESAHAKAA